MKNSKNLLSLILVLTMGLGIRAGETKNYFYKSISDFQEDRPMTGYEIEEGSWSMIVGKESAKIITPSGTERMSVNKFPSEFFLYDGVFMRGTENKFWLVLVVGNYCYYAQKSDNAKQSFSVGVHGEMTSFSESKLKKLLDEKGLKEDFEKDEPKRDKKQSANEAFNNRVQWYIKYFKLLNEKSKKG